MNGTEITVNGNVVDEVRVKQTVTGVSRLSFRVASTERRFDRESEKWVDGKELFINVVCWRDFAENVALSIKKGDPVLVQGKLASRSYIKDETNRMIYELDASAIGPNLAKGTARFQKRSRTVVGSVAVDADGFPERVSDEQEYILVDEDDTPAQLTAV